jgi:hypothetical protein
MISIAFWQGRRLYQVAPAREGAGFIGLCNGRVVATAPDRASVVRAVILSQRWRSRSASEHSPREGNLA